MEIKNLEEQLKHLKIGDKIKIDGEEFVVEKKYVNEENWADPPYKNYFYHLNKERYLDNEHHRIRFHKDVDKKWLGFLKYTTCECTPIEKFEIL